MTREEKFKIISNEYSDLIVEYDENMFILERFQNETVHIMNNRFAIAYLPTEQITGRSISLYGYSAMPSCYSLASTSSLEASGILRLRSMPALGLRGQGVLVGIIDTGIDYTNPIFMREDGTSKILGIWDQTIDSEYHYPGTLWRTFYGTQYTAEHINLALNYERPLDIVPSIDEIGHGTMLAGIAAGSENPHNMFSGVVPDADLVVVKLKQAKANLRNFFAIPMDVPCYQENDIMWGVQYVLEVARRLRRPIAVCIGLSSSQGAHIGRGSLSALLSVMANFPGVVISIAAGNEGNTRRHFYGEIDRSIGYKTVELNVGDVEKSFSMELWGDGPGTYSIDILSPLGEYIPRIEESIRGNREISFVFETTIIYIDYIMSEGQTGDQLILMRFRNPAPGIWRFNVYGRGDLQESFHIWLPVEGFITNDTYFVESNPFTTITSPGNSLNSITVAAYNPLNDTLFPRSGKGFTRTNAVKPELTAPGVNILSPNLEQGFQNVSGTSVAAAHMTGIAAMMIEWGIIRGNYPDISTVEVKKFLIRGARRSPNLIYPNRDWGYGIVDIYNVFDILRSDIL